MDPQDIELVRLAQAELPYRMVAFERLVAKRYGVVRRLAYAITGNRDDADTVAQDVMLRVFRGLRNLRDPATFDGWLRRIVRNTASSHVSAERRERQKANAWGQQVVVDTAREGVGDDLQPPQTESFDALVADLDLVDRTILAFRIVAELPYPDIAEIMEMTESAVKMRYRRTIHRLRLKHLHGAGTGEAGEGGSE